MIVHVVYITMRAAMLLSQHHRDTWLARIASQVFIVKDMKSKQSINSPNRWEWSRPIMT